MQASGTLSLCFYNMHRLEVAIYLQLPIYCYIHTAVLHSIQQQVGSITPGPLANNLISWLHIIAWS